MDKTVDFAAHSPSNFKGAKKNSIVFCSWHLQTQIQSIRLVDSSANEKSKGFRPNTKDRNPLQDGNLTLITKLLLDYPPSLTH